MAIAYDNSTYFKVGSATSITQAHTVVGSDRILFVYVYWNNSRTITHVKYNGVTMTAVGTENDNGGGERSNLFYLIAPATGENDVVVTLSGSSGIEGVASSYTGALQTAPIDVVRYEAAGLNTGTTYAEALTTVADNTWVIWGTRDYSGGTVSAGANTALRAWNPSIFGAILADSNAVVTPAGSRTLNLSNSISGNWYSDVLVSFKTAPVNIAKLKTEDTVTKAKLKTKNTAGVVTYKTADTVV